MATFEDIKLMTQTHQNLEGLRRDMRANAQSYLDALVAGRSIPQIKQVMTGNVNEYQKRLLWASNAWANLTMRAKIQSGLAAWSIPQAELTGIYNELKSAYDNEALAISVGINTALDVQNAANATLANVTNHEGIWPQG